MKKLASIFIMISVCLPIFGQESAPRHLRNLKNILKFKTTDQIMMALEPSLKMKESDFYSLIGAREWANKNEFTLHVFASPEKNSEPGKRFMACYITIIAYIPLFYSPASYMQALNQIGRGPTPRAALVDLVIKLAEEKTIDPELLLKKLKN